MARNREKNRKNPSDIPKGDFDESAVSRFDNLKFLAYGTILVVAGLAANYNDFGKMWIPPATSDETALFVARVTLFFELFVLAARWVIATYNEMEMWRERRPPTRPNL